jgi:hypothetical protein
MALSVSNPGRVQASGSQRPSSAAAWAAAGIASRDAAVGSGTIFYFTGATLIAGLRLNAAGTHLAVTNQSGESAAILDVSDGAPFFWCLSCSSTSVGGIAVYIRKLTDSAFTTSAQTATTATPTALAYGAASWGGEGFTGKLESMMCWNRALTAAEVEQQFGRRLPVAPNDLVHWIPAIGDTLAQAIGNYAGVAGGTSSTAPISVVDGAPVPWGAPSLVAPDAAAAPAELTGATTFAGMTSAGTATVDVVGTGATTFAGMTSAGTGTVDIAGTGATTFAGMTSAATATGDIAGTGATTFAGMTSAGTGTVDIAGTGATTFAGMTSQGEFVVGASPAELTGATTFEGMTSSGTLTVTDAPVASPPPPAFPDYTPAVNVAGGRRNRVLIRVDGRVHDVSYAEAAEIIRRQAEADAAEQRAERSKRQARAAARAAAQALRGRLVIDEPLTIDGIDPSVVADRMFKDLRDVYSQRLIESLVFTKQLQRKQADEQAAMAAAEMLLMNDDD